MFKRPAWATSSGNSTFSSSTTASTSSSFNLPSAPSPSEDLSVLEHRPTTSDSLFRHAARTHDAIVAGLAARRKKEASLGKIDRRSRVDRSSGEKRKGLTDQKNDSFAEGGEDEQEDPGAPIKDEVENGTVRSPTTLKKRRIDADDVKALLSRAGLQPLDPDNIEDEETEGAQPRARGGSYTEDDPIIIEDSDQDKESEVQIHDDQPATITQASPEEEDESDPELQELRRKARDRHKQAQERCTTPVTGAVGVSTSNPTHDLDPVVYILITSPIPNTNPLIVQRKLSQRLQEVRLAWCQRQGFTDEVKAKIYLTFRGRRKYDVTAVKSLGLEVDALGTVTMRNGDFGEEVDRIHLEAVTDEILAKQKEDGGGSLQQEVEGEAYVAEAEEEPQEQQQLIRLLIKAKGQKDFKLRVKPDTVISRIVNAARREFKVTGVGIAYLEFDGERLNPQDQVRLN